MLQILSVLFIDQAYQSHLIKLSIYTTVYTCSQVNPCTCTCTLTVHARDMCAHQRNSHAAVGPSQHCLLPWFCTEQATCDHDHTHLIEFVHGCGYYSRAATISFTEFQVWLLFEASCYLGCGFYSNKYSMHTVNGIAVHGCLSKNYIANMTIFYTKCLEQEMFTIYGTMY